jgi:glycosyltransferase involved in cell wall biosynthesis
MPNHEETLEEKQEAHNPNCFNLRRSDSLALDRDVPDVRKGGCIAMTYDVESLPPVSIVFVFFNEPLSPLLRSIVSVLNRSPARLIKEIILVDDGSTAPWTKEPLEEQLQLYPKVILRRMPVRQGLMATRTEGARIASASVVVFLDSHIEVQTAWLEPMIARLAGDRNRGGQLCVHGRGVGPRLVYVGAQSIRGESAVERHGTHGVARNGGRPLCDRSCPVLRARRLRPRDEAVRGRGDGDFDSAVVVR